MVCFIHRPEYYHITDDGKGNSLVGMAQFIIAKHRSGRIDDVLLRFQAELIRFEEPEAGANLLMQDDNPASTQIIMSGANIGGDGGVMPDFSQMGGDTPF